MMNRRAFALSSCVSLLALHRAEAQAINLSDEAIRDILRRRIDVDKRATGIAVGVVERGRRRAIVYGKQDLGDARSVGADTLFEIGSVTKVFTALLLADMVHRKELQFDHHVDRYLPSGYSTPQRNGRVIALADLDPHVGASLLPSHRRQPSRGPGPLHCFRSALVACRLNLVAGPGHPVGILQRRVLPSRSRTREKGRNDLRDPAQQSHHRSSGHVGHHPLSDGRSEPPAGYRTRSEAGADSAARSRNLRSSRSTPFHPGQPSAICQCGVAQFPLARGSAGPVAPKHPTAGSRDWRRSGTRLGSGDRNQSLSRQGRRDRRTGSFNRSRCAEANWRRGAFKCFAGDDESAAGWRRRRSGPGAALDPTGATGRLASIVF